MTACYGLTIYVFDPDGNMIELYEEDATPITHSRYN
jgi:catechol-2,3-dioxygenase